MEDYEKSISEFFSDIIYVDKNQCFIETTDIYKENGEIKKIHKKEEINLKDRITINESVMDLMAPEFGSYGIIDLIRRNSRKVDLNLYAKNKIHDIFRSKSKIKETFRLPSDYFIIASSKVEKIIKKYTSNKIYIIDSYDEFESPKLENYIIIGRKSKIIINKNIEKDKESEYVININLSLNYNDFYIVNLF